MLSLAPDASASQHDRLEVWKPVQRLRKAEWVLWKVEVLVEYSCWRPGQPYSLVVVGGFWQAVGLEQ
jgi:hypothetical protein